MKKYMLNKLLFIPALAAVIALSATGAGCSWFNKVFGNKLDTPVLQQTGSIYSWAEVEGADKYVVSTGGKQVYTEERTIRITNPDDGGKLTITAVSLENGEVKAKSDPAVIELAAIKKGGLNYREYDVTKGDDVVIARDIDKAVVKGDGGSHLSEISVEARTTPLIVELYDAIVYNFTLQEGCVTDGSACITVRSLGDTGNAVYGKTGASGRDGGDGDGLAGAGADGGNGGVGGDAATFGYVIFEGNRDILFRGGKGGRGGNGGKPNWMNSVGGDGGNGGRGGCGLNAQHAYVCLNGAELICEGGSGGWYGYGGSGKVIFGIDDSGDDGKEGADGESFRGEKIAADYLTVKIKPASEYSEEDSGNWLADPVVVQTGNTFSWNAVEGANRYRITTGDRHTYTDKTSIRIPNFDDGGKLTVTAVYMENGEVKKKSDPAEILCGKISKGGSNYKEYNVSGTDYVYIAANVEKVVLNGDGIQRKFKAYIKERTKPLVIELYNVNIIGGIETENGVEASVVIRSLGDTSNVITGEGGGKAGDRWEASQPGRDGSDGKGAVNLTNVVFEGNRDLKLIGGDGVGGGAGGKNQGGGGGKGGDGGNGGSALVSQYYYDFMTDAKLDLIAGNGGKGGEGGGPAFSYLTKGESGKDGVAGEICVGEKVDGGVLSIEIRPASEYTEYTDGANADEDINEGSGGSNEGDARVFGTYKFFSAFNGEETYYVGDIYEGEVITPDFCEMTFNSNGTCTFSVFGEPAEEIGTWELGGNLLIITNPRGDVAKGRVNGNEIELLIDIANNITVTLRK